MNQIKKFNVNMKKKFNNYLLTLMKQYQEYQIISVVSINMFSLLMKRQIKDKVPFIKMKKV